MSEPRPLAEADLVDLMRTSGALLEGHFLLTSGLHSPVYLQCARLLMDPGRAARVAEGLHAGLAARGVGRIEAVVAPAMGGIILGYELARRLPALSLFAERETGRFTLRRGFALAPGTRVVVAEDVVTTGLSTRECIACVRNTGAEVAAACCIVDRSGGRAEIGVPLIALATLDLPTYAPDALPPSLAAVPAVKPGSRPGVAP
ncbi:MAG: orotate phosphoribosyltransferase [Geminicoccaceae bacterium]|nr:orotate phosphoribosyltransferase [Geminicoccaceae bacterium]